MANLGGNFDANQVEPSGDLTPVPAGDYRAMIVESEIVDTKAGDGRYLKLTWKVEGGEHDGRLIWQNLNLWNKNTKAVEIAQRDLSAICHATGKLNVQDSDELAHIACLIRVSVRTDPNGNYAPQNEVKAVKPVGGGQPAFQPNGGGQQAAPAQAANSGGGLPWKQSA